MALDTDTGLPPEMLKKLGDEASACEARMQAVRIEEYRRMAAKAINDFAKDYCRSIRDRYGIDLQPSRTLVSLKKPKQYYDAIFEAAALMKRDAYLLDRTVKATIAEVFPEAVRRAGYSDHIPESAWYNPFGPSLQKRINRLLEDYGVAVGSNEYSSLAKVRDLIRSGRTPKGSADESATGCDLPTGKFHFNGDGTVQWFGTELKIQHKGAGRTRYVKVGGKDVNVVKALAALGVDRETVDMWAANADAAFKQRQEAEAVHDENLQTYGSKYD